jgi:predicted nucleic-acid-binding Zn-ribbon protein
LNGTVQKIKHSSGMMSDERYLEQMLSELEGEMSKFLPVELRKYDMVACIHIGLTSSGYSFSYTSNKQSIYFNKNWGLEIKQQSYTTSTCLLCDVDGRFVDFGYTAKQRHADMLEEDDKKYYLFERFMLKFPSQKQLNEKTEIRATNDKCMLLWDALSMSLKFMKNHLIKTIQDNGIDKTIDTHRIQWVVMVPSFWSEISKQFMRQAAFKAGLIDTQDSKALVIASESEAVAMYVCNLEINEFVFISENTVKKMTKGMKYVVLNASNLTCEVTAYEIMQTNHIKELHVSCKNIHNVSEQLANLTFLVKTLLITSKLI